MIGGRILSKLTIDNVRDQIIGIDRNVPLLDGSLVQYINLDNAATTPTLRPVFDKVNEFLTWYSSVERGAGFKSRLSTQMYNLAHEIVARFVGADPKQHTVIFTKNTTESINKLAHRIAFTPKDIVLRSIMEHHSNDLPWRMNANVEYININPHGGLDLDHLDQLIAKFKDRIRLIAISGASNVTGYLNPIHEIAEKAHAVGAEVFVDAAQLAPHRVIEMRPLDDPSHIDYLAMSAHKMYAPYGTGVLVGRKDTFLKGDPDSVGGGTIELVTENEVRWADLPEKEEAGTPNAVGAVALAEAILCMQQIGMESIADHEARLSAYLLRKLKKIDGISIYGDTDPANTAQRLGVIPFAVDGMPHQLLAAILAYERGIGVRNGCFCAHPYVLKLLHVSRSRIEEYKDEVEHGSHEGLPGLIRVSFGCYNEESEVDALIDQIERAVRGEYHGEYIQDRKTGEFHPKGFTESFENYLSIP